MADKFVDDKCRFCSEPKQHCYCDSKLTDRILALEDERDELKENGADLAGMASKFQSRWVMAEHRLRDFLDYFDPKGGVSDVPLGPFERAKEYFTETEADG